MFRRRHINEKDAQVGVEKGRGGCGLKWRLLRHQKAIPVLACVVYCVLFLPP